MNASYILIKSLAFYKIWQGGSEVVERSQPDLRPWGDEQGKVLGVSIGACDQPVED